jgi:hypothetical protein
MMHLLFEGFRFSFVVVLLSSTSRGSGCGKSALEFCLTVRTPQGMIVSDRIARLWQAKAGRGRLMPEGSKTSVV